MNARIAMMMMGLWVAMPAQALVFTVGEGDTAALVAAIEAANATPEPDLIELDRGLFLLEEAWSDSKAGLPPITAPLRIRGRNTEIRRYSSEPFRLFHVAQGGHLILERVTLAEGNLGALRNDGTTDLRWVQIVDNDVKSGHSVVENYGTLTVKYGQVSFNTVANASRDTGVLVNYGLAWLHDTTVQRNALTRRYGSVVLASAVLNYGEAVLKNVRILENDGGYDDGYAQGTIVNLGKGVLHAEGLSERGNEPRTAQLTR